VDPSGWDSLVRRSEKISVGRICLLLTLRQVIELNDKSLVGGAYLKIILIILIWWNWWFLNHIRTKEY
jgi:hypothetical protein